jgi:hypothetical protein
MHNFQPQIPIFSLLSTQENQTCPCFTSCFPGTFVTVEQRRKNWFPPFSLEALSLSCLWLVRSPHTHLPTHQPQLSTFEYASAVSWFRCRPSPSSSASSASSPPPCHHVVLGSLPGAGCQVPDHLAVRSRLDQRSYPPSSVCCVCVCVCVHPSRSLYLLICSSPLFSPLQTLLNLTLHTHLPRRWHPCVSSHLFFFKGHCGQ